MDGHSKYKTERALELDVPDISKLLVAYTKTKSKAEIDFILLFINYYIY